MSAHRRSPVDEAAAVREDESTWRGALAAVPRWSPPATRTVLVVPHPDDEVLGCGGLVRHQRRRGLPVVVVAVSDGEAAYPGDAALGAVRVGEQERALAHLGVAPDAIVRLGWPDGALDRHVDALAEVLVEVADADDLVVAPWIHDVHPDHEACGDAARAAAAVRGNPVVSTLFWAWQHLPLAAMPLASLVRLEMDADAVQARWDALACHRSQLVRPGGAPVLPADVLGPLGRDGEVYLR